MLITRLAGLPVRLVRSTDPAPNRRWVGIFSSLAPIDGLPYGLRSTYLAEDTATLLSVMSQVAIEYVATEPGLNLRPGTQDLAFAEYNHCDPDLMHECDWCGGYVYIATQDAEELAWTREQARVWCSERCMRQHHQSEQNADGNR